jgi:two-component system, cell cycle sensor histidine kinase and response regulator CckA
MSTTKGEGPSSGTETVLLAEPDPEVRSLAGFMLSRLGYSVLEARNAMEALKIYDERGGGVDLLLAEALMPRVNGHELAQMIEARDTVMRVLFLADAGYERLTRRTASRKGLVFLTHPFTMSLLAAKVREALDRPARRIEAMAAGTPL